MLASGVACQSLSIRSVRGQLFTFCEKRHMSKHSTPAAQNPDQFEPMLAIRRRQFLGAAAAATFGQTGQLLAATRSGSSSELHELGLAAAARAIRNGEVSSEAYVGKLLERERRHADLKAFITIDEASVLECWRRCRSASIRW